MTLLQDQSLIQQFDQNDWNMQQDDGNNIQYGFEKAQKYQQPFIFNRYQLPGLPKNEVIKYIKISQICTVVLSNNNKIYRWRQGFQNQLKYIQFSGTGKKQKGNIHKIYMDYIGYHIIICYAQYYYYLYYRQKKFRSITSWKGLKISALAFHLPPNQIELTKNQINLGIVYFEKNTGICRLKLQFHQNQLTQIIQPRVIQFPTEHQVVQIQLFQLKQVHDNNIIIIIATNTKLYLLNGKNNFIDIIQKYKFNFTQIKFHQEINKIVEEQESDNFATRIQKSSLHYVQIIQRQISSRIIQQQIVQPVKQKIILKIGYSRKNKRVNYIIWFVNKKCILFKIPNQQQTNLNCILNKPQYLKLAKNLDFIQNNTQQSILMQPISIGVTDYNYYMVYVDCIAIMSLITQRITHLFNFNQDVVMKDMVFDIRSYNYILYQDTDLHILVTTNENSEALRISIQQKRYKQAYNISRQLNVWVQNTASCYADSLFIKKKYKDAAIIYHQTCRCFQEILLKFLQEQDRVQAVEGIILYLRIWLEKQDKNNKFKVTLLVSFLIEVCSYYVAALERGKINERPNYYKGELDKKKQYLSQLIQTNIDKLNENLLQQIIFTYGRAADMFKIAKKRNNLQHVIYDLLTKQHYNQALQYLKQVKQKQNILNQKIEQKQLQKQKNKDRNKSKKKFKNKKNKYQYDHSVVNKIIYRYSNVFFKCSTDNFVSLLKYTLKKQVNPISLIIGSMSIPSQYKKYNIQLLQYCVIQLKIKNKVLSNLLIYSYLADNDKDKIKGIIQHIKNNTINIDLDFTLRLFHAYHIIQGEIVIYGKLNLLQKAVELSLRYQQEQQTQQAQKAQQAQQAKYYANKSDDLVKRKQLLMLIIRQYFTDQKKIQYVLKLMQQSAGLIKIQDIIPYFNQNIATSTQLTQLYKNQICKSLQDHNETIMNLNMLIKNYKEDTQKLNNQLKFIKNISIVIDKNNKCQQCYKNLYYEDFYFFSCMHGFHKCCLFDAIKIQPILTKQKLQRIQKIEKQIAVLKNRKKNKKEKKEKKEVQKNNEINENNNQLSSLKLIHKISSTLIPQSFIPQTFVKTAKSLWNKKDQQFKQFNYQIQDYQIKKKYNQINQIIAAQCIYCGTGVVDSIVMGFNNKELMESWKV